MRRSGFTLIETVVALTVLAIVGSVAFTGTMRVVDLSGETNRATQGALDGWSALIRIGDDIEHAAAVTTPATGGNSQSLTLTRDAASYAACLTCVDRSLSVRYQLDGATGRLLRIGDGTASPVVSHVTSFTVTATAASAPTRLYTVSLTIAPQGDRPRTFTTAFRPLRTFTGQWARVIR